MTDVLDSPDAGARAVRGGAARVIGYGAGVLLSVGSAALLFRYLGVNGSGRYVLVVSLVTIAVGVTEGGLTAIGVRELVQRDAAESPGMLRSLLALRVLLSAAGIALACLYAELAGFGPRLVVGTGLAGVATLLQGVQAVLSVRLQARLRFVAVAVADLVRLVANVLAIVALVLAGAGLLSFFGALVFANLAGLVACLVLLGGAMPLRPAFDRVRWAALLRMTLPYAMAAAIAVVYLRIGLLFLDRLAGPHQTGLYGVSFRVIDVVSQVPALVATTAFPLFARAASDDRERLSYAVQRVVEASLLLGALVALLLVTGAPTVITIVGGSRFRAADPVLRWHALAVLGTFAAQPFAFALLAIGRTRAVLVQTAAAMIVAVAATIPLASAFGAVGAAGAAAAAEWTLAICGWLLLATAGGPVVRFGTPLRTLLLAGVALLPMAVLPPLPAAAVAGIAYLCLCLLAGVVPGELREAFRGGLRRGGLRAR